MTGSAAPREAVMGAVTYRCAHTGTPVNGECADCATLADEILTALATVDWREQISSREAIRSELIRQHMAGECDVR